MKLKGYLGKSIIGQVIIDILVTICFYFLIPTIMNYAPYSIEKNFIGEYVGVSYNVQALSMFLPYIFVVVAFLVIYLNDLFKYRNVKIEDLTQETKNRLSGRLLNTPILCYLIKIICIPVTVLITLIVVDVPVLITVKLTIVLSSAFLLDGTIIYIFIKNTFRDLIKAINNEETITGKRITVRTSVLIQFLSIILAGITFISILAYSRLIEEIGDNKYQTVDLKLAQCFEELEIEKVGKQDIFSQIKKYFNDDSYTIFAIDPEQNVECLDNKQLPEYPVVYTSKIIKMGENRIYGVSKETQGVIRVVDLEDGQYVFGVFYNTIPLDAVRYFLYTIGILVILNIAVIIYYSANMSKNVSEVTEAIEKVVSKNEEVDYDKKLPITSNDEIGDLVVAFNKILDLEKKNVEKIERNQEILVEQERLSSLGQLIGGIAHNLKTPIMSIAGALEGLTDLVKEYDESIEDKQVTAEDHHEIAKEMQTWIDKIRPYLSYMTEVIDTVKGQAVSMNATTMKSFTAEELMARVKILLRDTLKKKHCNLNLDIQVDKNTYVTGEISAIIQVLDNIIINAVDAYGENGGDIDLKIYEDESKMYFEIKDTAGGIPESVQERLFKEMITSKGKDGTGLGLYMSYSTVKGKFNGDMRYETEQGVGTTFFIELNKENTK